jgi:D-aspartate ligase
MFKSFHERVPKPAGPEKTLSPERRVPAVLCGDLNMLRCFVGSGIKTVIFSTNQHEATLWSRHCAGKHVVPPVADDRLLLSEFDKLSRSLGDRPVLYYGTDAMLLLIARNCGFFADRFRFRMPARELVEKLVDKSLFAELARSLELPVPMTLGSGEIGGASEILERIGLPCLFKPAVHIGWFKARAEHGLSPHKALRAETWAELQDRYEELRAHRTPFVVQRYVRGGEDCIYSYHAYLDAHSRPLGEFVGKKLRTYPKHAGVSTFLELVKDPEVLDAGRHASERLALVGPLKLDFKRDAESGELFLLEVNARFTLWNHLGAVSGVNLPALAYADLTGEPSAAAPGDYRTDVRWLSFGNDVRAYLREYRKDKTLGLRGWLASLRGPVIYDIFAWDDPLPLAKNALNYGEALARRLLPRRRAPA